MSDSHRLLALDLPGHGGAPGPFSLDGAVEAVGVAIDDAGGSAHLVGISGGAVVALLACLQQPARVEKLILSAGLAHAPGWFALQRAIARITPERALARLLRGTYSGGQTEYEQTAERDFRACGKGNYLTALREIAGLDLRSRLQEVAVPTLVLCGSKDRANVALSKELAAGIPATSLRIVPDATHLWNLQMPDLFNQTLTGFIDEGTSPAG